MYGIWLFEKDKDSRRIEPSRGERPRIASTPVEERRRNLKAIARRRNPQKSVVVRATLNERICFFPIWSPTANLILEGKKRIEFRRVPPALTAPFAAILYDPAEQAMRAVLRIRAVLRGVPTVLVEEVEALDEARGQSRGQILAYIQSAPNPGALVIDKVIRVGPFRLDEIRRLVPWFTVPQKFTYLSSQSTLCRMVQEALEEVGQGLSF
jgi:predicted transcriptional regulator